MSYTLSTADHGCSPPRLAIPRRYNAADDLIGRNLANGRADKTAYIDDGGQYTYGELARRANRVSNALGALGLEREQRILMCVHDTIDFPAVFLGAIRAGIVPVATNTLLTQNDYEYMLTDSRARVAVVSAPLAPLFEPLLGKVPTLERIIVAGATGGATRSRRCWRTLPTPSKPSTPPVTTPVSGSIPRDRPEHPRAPCMCTRASSRQPNSTGAACSASVRTTSCSPRPSSSSPTAWATG